ncbi:glycoprotein [Wuhan Insect virus 5]|uniref:Glycoprotein n=1 Tax=Wuhan Insect virus 5 TaxID=1608110 RepID=A0A0B5KF26_9RHAB|nr:glycoprotein [Wuhan Insect virus 5]AJG39184.1 glycoprotein [Wuhan Insect virus 5]
MSVLVLIVLYSCFLTDVSAEQFFNATVGPYSVCGSKSANIESKLKECYSRCRKPPQPAGGYTVTIYEADVKNGGPNVVECRKVTIEQTFTKSWLFSTTTSEPRIVSQAASESECRDAISKNCPSYDCNLREPSRLDAEFNYAADTVVRKSFITAQSMPSSILTHGGDIIIMPLSSEKQFKITDEKGQTAIGMYIWKTISKYETCPFSARGKYGCDYYDHDGPDKHFLCARGGFTLTLHDKVNKAIPSCPDIFISGEGILFTMDQESDLNLYSQRISLTGSQYKQEDTESFRNKMNHVLANLDSDLCVLQCEVLSLEARIKRDQPKLLKIGSDMVLLEPNGTGVGCSPAYGCSLIKPHILCGNPPRVGISCTGKIGYWDPTSPYVQLGGICSRPMINEKINFTAGHHVYVLDDDLTIQVPSGFMHGRSADVFSSDHMSGLDFTKTDIEELRASWAQSKSSVSQKSSEFDANKNVTATHLDGNVLMWPGLVAHMLAHKLKEAIIFVVIILAIIVSAYVGIKWIASPKPVFIQYPSVSYNQNPQEESGRPRWI